MPSTFHGLGMMSQALRAFQRGLDVTGHNISNVNTVGYSRQSIEYAQMEPTTFHSSNSPFALGNGITISGVNRIRDMFLQSRYVSSQADLGRYQTLASSLSQVEPLLNEPGANGISDALNKFWNAWSGLASNPTDAGARREVQMAGNTLSQRIQTLAADYNRVTAQVTSDLRSTFNQIDDISKKIAQLNAEIKQKAGLGGTPNDLLDQRDMMVQELGKLIPITTYTQDDGSYTVYMGQYSLIDAGGAHAIPRNYDLSTNTISDGVYTYSVNSGKLRGLFDTLNQIGSYRSGLDTLANTLRDQVNSMHLAGTNPNGTTNLNFFDPASTGALDFRLDKLIADDASNISSGTSGNAGDGYLALSLSQLRDVAQSGLGNLTFGAFYSDYVGQVGRDAQAASTSLSTQGAVVQQIEMQIQSVSGVSLDDEMASMLRLQRSYQAAAKTLSIMDQVTEDLINMMR